MRADEVDVGRGAGATTELPAVDEGEAEPVTIEPVAVAEAVVAEGRVAVGKIGDDGVADGDAIETLDEGATGSGR